MPSPVCFAFPDRPRCVSSDGAWFLVKQLRRRLVVSEAADALADRIATEVERGTFQEPVRDLELTAAEAGELLEALDAGDWLVEEKASLRQLHVALAALVPRES